MRFNSLEFVIFFAVVFFVLWRFNKRLRTNNIILLVASYAFYGWWDYRFLFLILASSVVDYVVGYKIPESKNKKAWLSVSLIVNLGLLMFFKYYNFFVESANDLMESLGYEGSNNALNIILPVGISFYTFQTLSYSLDVYKGKIKPQKDLLAFLNYVSFFPQLIAGPIERASTFLPQFLKKREFNYDNAIIGSRLLLYGFFKKMVIADNIGLVVDGVYANIQNHSSAELLVAALLFFVQLYCDFSAYTDIARGAAKLLGFELMKNFKTPLFSKSIPEFWTRWHISLTTWFRDYFFIWLAGLNKKSTLWRILATIILFFVIGLWHGANYTFAIFGLLNGIFYIPRILARKNRVLRNGLKTLNTNPVLSKFAIVFTYLLLSITGILFRSPDIQTAGMYYSSMLSFDTMSLSEPVINMIYVSVGILAYEWIMKEKSHPFEISNFNPILRRSIYVVLIVLILVVGYFGKEPFYYFQF
ncbi:MBOAT family O-acyltransferase [Salibacter halophilus]|uniref:MBOAT family protein n=1 Tax=Salibacter halophilus TaxID=1803916 RepID=A0A6N6M6L9_9FLAO|nr:MBOAT family O-acyltransferase [Salibacter halophilus]KAB1063979.1 MBOAT family protein [Salibacter halophilus]